MLFPPKGGIEERVEAPDRHLPEDRRRIYRPLHFSLVSYTTPVLATLRGGVLRIVSGIEALDGLPASSERDLTPIRSWEMPGRIEPLECPARCHHHTCLSDFMRLASRRTTKFTIPQGGLVLSSPSVWLDATPPVLEFSWKSRVVSGVLEGEW